MTNQASAAAIAAQLGRRLERVDSLGGVENRVQRMRGPGFDWVLRTPVDPSAPDTYPLEAWAIGAARAAGVHSPAVVALGDRFLVLEYEPPRRAIDDPWHTLGAFASAVACIPLDDAPDGVFSRFGRDLAEAWRAHVRYNVEALSTADPLLHQGVYAEADRARIRDRIAPLEDEPFAHGLAHGDLAPRNLIARDHGAALIDWGSVTTGPAPWTELQRVYQEQQEEVLAAFAAGAGVALDASARDLLHRLTVLRALDLARWAREHRPALAAEYAASAARLVRSGAE
ncbi:phosphotransferase [Microbacteriaceae bacterium VKM Ac-2855]|nr:phosphotransferase [Microbacteriaceae bacterium VKM Ac-2855]